jgi:hypothetical protein
MEFEKFIGGKFKMFTLPCMLSKHESVFTTTSCCRGATLGKSFSFFGLNVVKPSLMTFFCFNVVQPWAGHFY